MINTFYRKKKKTNKKKHHRWVFKPGLGPVDVTNFSIQVWKNLVWMENMPSIVLFWFSLAGFPAPHNALPAQHNVTDINERQSDFRAETINIFSLLISESFGLSVFWPEVQMIFCKSNVNRTVLQKPADNIMIRWAANHGKYLLVCLLHCLFCN